MKEDELFTPVTSEELEIEEYIRPGVGYWADVWRRLKKNKLAL